MNNYNERQIAADRISEDLIEFIEQSLALKFGNKLELFSSFSNRIAGIEKSLQAHAEGQQRVYDYVKSIEEKISSKEMQKLIDYLDSFNKEKVTEELNEINQFMGSYFVRSTIQEFQHFKSNMESLIKNELDKMPRIEEKYHVYERQEITDTN